MTRVLVYSTSGDEALATARCIAEWTEVRLVAESHAAHLVCDIDRLTLETLVDGADGLAAFTHGSKEALFDGSRRPMVDAGNVAMLTGRWAWLYACYAGHELAGRAVHAGAVCVAGFDVPVHVDWVPETLPPGLRTDFERLVTEVPSLLAAGQYGGDEIRAAVLPLVDAILDYCQDHQETFPPGIDITAEQMLRRLVIRSPTVDLE